MNTGKLVSNPYVNRRAILSPNDFFGRVQQLHDIYTRIQGGQSVSLVGERRIGKSSILYALRSEHDEYLRLSESEEDTPLTGAFDFVLVDIQSLTGCTEDEFLEYLLNQVTRVTGVEVASQGRMALRATAEELQRRGRRLIILLDEFDVLVYNNQIPRELFSILRSMATEFCVTFVVASREGSIDHLAEDTKTGSAFLNIFGTVYIGPFQEDEAKELIHAPAARRGIDFTSEEEKLILNLAGFFPFFLQIACYHMFKLKQSELPIEQARLQFEKNFVLEAKPHFEYMLKRMQDYEQQALRFWLQNGYMEDESARDALINKGILIQSQGRVRVFSQIFEKMVSMRASAINQLISTVGNIIRGKSSQ